MRQSVHLVGLFDSPPLLTTTPTLTFTKIKVGCAISVLHFAQNKLYYWEENIQSSKYSTLEFATTL